MYECEVHEAMNSVHVVLSLWTVFIEHWIEEEQSANSLSTCPQVKSFGTSWKGTSSLLFFNLVFIAHELHDWLTARNVPLIQKRYVTDLLPGMSHWSKNVTWLTGCQECPFDPKTLRDWQAARYVPVIQKLYVSNRLPKMSLWSKNVTWLTGCQECCSDPKTLCDWQAVRNVSLIQKCYVTNRLPGMSLWSKNVIWLTQGAKWPFRCLNGVGAVWGAWGLSEWL